ncbi:hypothetical protein [Deinococcus sedimenti]|uniref:Uncharacterized protein n=1 Tax=Deinococcus sedimenti TaxID=1867090 RepID=A0ABQ2S323_9DEIO|nr:hypothetical protein [Deinococcus sedimenti]GGR84359.1 hypothetical protein GCM10008960_09240 [Deinococcus sedimenti]
MNPQITDLTVAELRDLNRVSREDARAALLTATNPQPDRVAARSGRYIPDVRAAAQDLCETGDLQLIRGRYERSTPTSVDLDAAIARLTGIRFTGLEIAKLMGITGPDAYQDVDRLLDARAATVGDIRRATSVGGLSIWSRA